MDLGSEEKFIIISHRGASYYEPENTISSFRKALELGFNILEFDIRQTADSRLVVIHDKTVNRTTNGKGLVRSMTFDELRELDAGGGEKIPLFEEVVKKFGEYANFVIELKESGFEEEVLQISREYSILDRSYFVSFNKSCLRNINLIDPAVKTGLITVFGFGFIKNAIDCGCSIVATNHRFVTRNKIQKARDHGLKFFCWTVNDRKRAELLKNIGVDGIITDRPDIFSKL